MELEYSFDFSARLVEAAEFLSAEKKDEKEANRAILYLSLLSCEISIKVLLAKNGVNAKTLKKHSHDFSKLLGELAGYYLVDKHKLSASCIRSIVVDKKTDATIGFLLCEAIDGKSVYPSDIRYKTKVAHFSPEIMLGCAQKVYRWCELHLLNLEKRK